MFAWRRWSLAIALLFSLSLFAQDKGEEKKTDSKDKMEKKDDKKAAPKEEKKPAEKTNKYQLVRTITGSLVKSDTDEMLIEVEVPVREGRYMHNKKETLTIA